MYEVIKGRIDGKTAGETVQLSKEIAESYGEEYLKPVEAKKQAKNTQNKALSNTDAETKDE